MPNLTIDIKYDYANELQVNVEDFIADWLFGIPLRDNYGKYYTISAIRKKLIIAQTILENLIGVKLFPVIVNEKKDFVQEEFMSFGHIKLNFPATKLLPSTDGNDDYLQGFFNESRLIGYKKDWIQVRSKEVSILPGTGGRSQMSISALGLVIPGSNFGQRYVPDFWRIRYLTGFNILPYDIEEVLSKLAVISVLGIIGDVLLPIGISSQSLSIDGLSQSISNTLSNQGNIFNPRITTYYKDLFDPMFGSIMKLRMFYNGISFQTL